MNFIKYLNKDIYEKDEKSFERYKTKLYIAISKLNVSQKADLLLKLSSQHLNYGQLAVDFILDAIITFVEIIISETATNSDTPNRDKLDSIDTHELYTSFGILETTYTERAIYEHVYNEGLLKDIACCSKVSHYRLIASLKINDENFLFRRIKEELDIFMYGSTNYGAMHETDIIILLGLLHNPEYYKEIFDEVNAQIDYPRWASEMFGIKMKEPKAELLASIIKMILESQNNKDLLYYVMSQLLYDFDYFSSYNIDHLVQYVDEALCLFRDDLECLKRLNNEAASIHIRKMVSDILEGIHG